MREFWLWRFPSIKDGTFGVILDGDLPFCLSVERPWLNNQRNISCYPDGDYICKRVQSPKFGNTFEITCIPNRTDCLFHKGNIMDDSHGCTVLGEQYEYAFVEKKGIGRNGVVSTGKAFDEFLKRTEGIDEFVLHVRWI
jgi:hypothetical protein